MIGATSPISSSEVGTAASIIGRIKTAFRSTLKNECESYLNLVQMYTTGSINVEEVVHLVIRKSHEDCFHSHWFLLNADICF